MYYINVILYIYIYIIITQCIEKVSFCILKTIYLNFTPLSFWDKCVKIQG